MGHLIQNFFLFFRIKNLLKAFSNSPFLVLNLISKSPKRFEKTYFGSSIRIKIWLTIQFYFNMYRNFNNKNSKKHAFYIFVNLTFSKKHACWNFMRTFYMYIQIMANYVWWIEKPNQKVWTRKKLKIASLFGLYFWLISFTKFHERN